MPLLYQFHRQYAILPRCVYQVGCVQFFFSKINNIRDNIKGLNHFINVILFPKFNFIIQYMYDICYSDKQMYLYAWTNVAKRYNEIHNRVKQLQEEIAHTCFVEHKTETRTDTVSSCNNVSLSGCCDVPALIWLNGGHG